MNGQPVWLASISSRNKRGFIATGDYTEAMMLECQDILRDLLRGVGDDSRMRCFRMNLTVCLHKAATDIEVGACRPDWQAAPPIGIAGPPVEILWETVPASESCKPCANPTRGLLDRSRPDLWVPIPCGQCSSCIARAACIAA